MTDNPYEPPQSQIFSEPVVQAAGVPTSPNPAVINGRIVRKYFLLTSPAYFIFCGMYGAIFNPIDGWSGQQLGRLYNFVAYFWPISVAPGVLNMICWPLAFIVIFAASFARPLMRNPAPLLMIIIAVGINSVMFGAFVAFTDPDRKSPIAPMLLGDGCGLIFFAVMTLRAIRKSQSRASGDQ